MKTLAMLNDYDLLNDIICSVNVQEVPIRFIRMAKVHRANGRYDVLEGKALREFWEGRGRCEMEGVSIILDANKMREAIRDEVNYVYGEIERRCEARWANK